VRSYFNSRRPGTAPFHPYRAGPPEGAAAAVYFLWHFPYRRRTPRKIGNPPPALAVSEHTALRSSDFPLPRPCQSRGAGTPRRGSDHPACSRRLYDSLVDAAGQTAGLGMIWNRAPKGIGTLYIRRKSPSSPRVHGGHQERNRRPCPQDICSGPRSLWRLTFHHLSLSRSWITLSSEGSPSSQTRCRPLPN
jgi:hypothetical protein